MRSNEVLPCRALASFRCRSNAAATKDVADHLVGNNMAEISQCSDDAIITQPEFSFAIWIIRSVTSRLIRGSTR